LVEALTILAKHMVQSEKEALQKEKHLMRVTISLHLRKKSSGNRINNGKKVKNSKSKAPFIGQSEGSPLNDTKIASPRPDFP
jgi:hypothetical protein